MTDWKCEKRAAMSCYMPKLVAPVCCRWGGNILGQLCAPALLECSWGQALLLAKVSPTQAGGSSLTDVSPGLRQTMCTGRC